MSEDKDLLARISQLAGELVVLRASRTWLNCEKGHINLHKTQRPSEQVSSYDIYQSSSQLGYGPVRAAPSRRIPRGTPYNHGRAGRVAPQGHRNRTLILNGTAGRVTGAEDTTVNRSDEDDPDQPVQQKSGWVTKRDRHMQLINSSVFDKETQVRSKAIAETRRQKAQQRDQREELKIQKHLQFLSAAAERPSAFHPITPNSILHELVINGIHFQVVDGGSKLSRVAGKTIGMPEIHKGGRSSCIPGASDATRSTPKKANVGGVTFLRSKNGNLYRSGIVKARK
ncbi:hypothetical protein MMC08_000476 [Hypocenomyce scalaris]|nr:hypothetical protein [Hypocenomyce scalaris]